MFFRTIGPSDVASSSHIATPRGSQMDTSYRLAKRGIFGDAWKAVKNTTSKVRHSLRDFYDNTTNKLTEGVESFKTVNSPYGSVDPHFRADRRHYTNWMLCSLHKIPSPTSSCDHSIISTFPSGKRIRPRVRNRGNHANAIRAESPNDLEMEPPLFDFAFLRSRTCQRRSFDTAIYLAHSKQSEAKNSNR